MIRNFLAIIGLLALISHSIVFVILTIKTNLSPLELSKKIVGKGVAVFYKVGGASTKKPITNQSLFKPVGLSPHVSLKPIDEQLLYNRRILRVGPKRKIKRPSDAAKIAKNGDIIEIDAGVYVGDVALWQTPQLKIRGVGGRAIMEASGRAVEGKAIWIIRAHDVFIENIGFKNCKVRDRNGAGIRVEGDNLTVRNALFWSNENGILCGGLKSIHSLTVRYSEFGFNGFGDGQSHGIYVGQINEFVFEFNYVHHTKSGHHVKSRARSNQIGYNFLTDHETGNASYAIDLQNGGKAIIIGNILQQSKFTENSSLVHYGMPGSKAGQPIYIINNTVVSDRNTGIFVLNHSPAQLFIVNNLIMGKLNISTGKSTEHNNMKVTKNCFYSYPGIEYALNGTCKAINKGFEFEGKNKIFPTAQFEYVHPLSKKKRNYININDIGAYEYQ